jgi:23S rRNA (adenine2030-N6)-methyltransferase
MNYRHAFHAGNAGDVLKHIVFAFVLDYLKDKDAPFCVVDVHAGLGLYDLSAEEAQRTGEWHKGIGRLWRPRPSGEARIALAPWYDVVDACNEDGRLAQYPGSPEIALRLSRVQDRLILCETEPSIARALGQRYRHDTRVEVVPGDGWATLLRRMPPRERRGVVLLDPAYEARDDYVRAGAVLTAAHRRFATGIYLLWYPVKGSAHVKRLRRALAESGMAKVLRAELHTRTPNHPNRLDGAGMIIVNPPWTLAPALGAALPVLAARLATGPSHGHVLDWIAEERGTA